MVDHELKLRDSYSDQSSCNNLSSHPLELLDIARVNDVEDAEVHRQRGEGLKQGVEEVALRLHEGVEVCSAVPDAVVPLVAVLHAPVADAPALDALPHASLRTARAALLADVQAVVSVAVALDAIH